VGTPWTKLRSNMRDIMISCSATESVLLPAQRLQTPLSGGRQNDALMYQHFPAAKRREYVCWS
jgi:hypothetical protein